MSLAETPIVKNRGPEKPATSPSLDDSILAEFQKRTEIVLETPNTYSFPEAAEVLKKVDFDLERARRHAIKHHEEWGLIEALRQKGVVQSTDEYSKIFDHIQFSKEGLDDLAQKLDVGLQWMPVFNPGHLTLSELWQVLIGENGLDGSKRDKHTINPHESTPQEIVARFKEFDPNQFEVTAEDRKQRRYAELQKLKVLYQTSQKPTQSPKIIFTNDIIELDAAHKSPVDFIQACKEGLQCIDLPSDLIRWFTQFKNRETMPDKMVHTLYPGWVDNNGQIAMLGIFNSRGFLSLQGYYPTHKHHKVGVRPVLG